jgi:hypothetical protein
MRRSRFRRPIDMLLNPTEGLFQAAGLGDAHINQDVQETLDFLSHGLAMAERACIKRHNCLDHDT